MNDFDKTINMILELNAAGAGGVFGGGPSFGHEGGFGPNDFWNPNDSRKAHILGFFNRGGMIKPKGKNKKHARRRKRKKRK
jgi:hypothetical protein